MARGGPFESILARSRRNQKTQAAAQELDPTAQPAQDDAPLLAARTGNISGFEADRQIFQGLLRNAQAKTFPSPSGQPPSQATPVPAIPPEAQRAAVAVLTLEEAGELPPLPDGYRSELQALATPPTSGALAPPEAPTESDTTFGGPPDPPSTPDLASLRRDALLTG